MREKAVFNWSGGKDSAMCLHRCREIPEHDIRYLLTSVNAEFGRISMHGVRVELLKMQAERIGIPLKILEAPNSPEMEDYNRTMRSMMEGLRDEGIGVSIFGDIFLEDLRRYREDQLAKVSMRGAFPIWKQDTTELVREFIDLGFKAIVVCVNESNLDESFAGRTIDADFLRDLPPGVDPCGENGEFHSFVFDGPIFRSPIRVKTGEVVYKRYNDAKTGFWYCDLLPEGSS